MIKYIIAIACAAIVFGVLESFWLRWAGPNLYRPVIGELMADEFKAAPAIAFYIIYMFGVTWFAIKPGIESGQVMTALINGLLLGALCYATFDLTSQAVFKVWSTQISVMDIIYGGFATGVASAAATYVALRFTN